MGGDVLQWNEETSRIFRGLRGGTYQLSSNDMTSSRRNYDDPVIAKYYYDGFRVASVPEPGSLALLLAGAFGVLAFPWRRRRGAKA